MVAAFELSKEDHQALAILVTNLMEPLSVFDWSNGHVSDRKKENMKRLTVCQGYLSFLEEPTLDFHTIVPFTLAEELKFTITKISDYEVDIDFTIGELNEESLDQVHRSVQEMFEKVDAQAKEKKRFRALSRLEKKLKRFSTKYWKGLYLYRGKISDDNSYWKNFEEALRLNIASPAFIQSLKDWNFYFRDY